ncbi:MAG: hypothetical protein IK092_07635, partial [Muribaculaceae bacterium]|nr:hypothetical protein [Muribaculaceae bacterium]
MGKERKHHIKNKWVRRTVKTLCVIILLIILLPFTLYIPWVQNIAKNTACNYISEKTGLEVTIDRLLIKFPLDISLDNVLVLDQNRDTMAHVGNFNAGVELLPLLSLNVKVGTTTLTDAKMHIVSKDSSSIINAKLQKAVVLGSDIDLTHHRIKLLHGDLSDGDIHFESFPYKVIEEPDTTPPSQWDITVGKLNLNRVKCTMASEPTIDNLTANVVAGQLVDAHINMDKHTIEAGFIRLDSLDCNYTTRNEKEIAAFNKEHPIPPKLFQSNDTATWTIKGDSLRINGSRIAYNVAGANPQKGFDSNNIVLDNFNLAIDNYYNRGSTVVLPVKNLTLDERCGLKVKRAHGTVSLTDGNITASNMHVKTAQSTINLNANINTKALDKPPMGTISINTDSEISPQELAMISPEAGAMLAQVPQNKPIKVKASISGNQQKVTIDHFNAVVPNYAHATVSGTITNPLDSKRRKGELDVDADFRNVDFINDIMRKSMAGNSINIPPVAMKGHISLDGDRYTADANMNLYNGKMVGKAYFNGYKEEYDIDATFNGFPVRSIMPNSPVGNITGRVKAKGHGFDFLNGTAQADADMKLASIEYNKHTFNNIDLQARLNKNRLNAALSSHGKHCDLDLACNATFNKSTYDYDINGSINDLDLYQLGFSESPMAGKGKINAKGVFNTNTLMGYSDIKVTDMQCRIDNESFMADELTASVLSESDNVSITLDNEDTHLRFLAACGLQEFIDKMSNSATKASQQLENRSLDINALQASLPKFNFGLKMGSDGIIPRYLARQDIEFRDFNCDIQNDSTLYLNGWIKQMSIGTTSIDTITFNANEMNRYLAFKAHMGNRPGTLDDFAQVDINGGAVGSTVDVLVHQQNIKGKTGYRLGVNATLVDSMINMKLFPENPVIGYRQWELNDDNFLHYYYKNNMVDANLKLNSGSSLVAIRTEDAGSPNKRNILLNIKDLKIEEWLSLTPNESPPMSGTLGADMKLAFDGHNLDGGGTVGIKNFIYNGHREGDISLNTQLAVDPATSSTKLNATMNLDGSQVAIAYGSLNDSTAKEPFNMNVKLNKFPLNKAAAFIPGRVVRLGGFLDGDLAVTGSMSDPIINGSINGDSAVISLTSYGSKLTLANTPITITNNLVKFNKFDIIGMNNNPITVDGTVDINTMDINLRAKGDNVQFIGSEQRRFSEVFGKAFANIDATVKGNNNLIDAR